MPKKSSKGKSSRGTDTKGGETVKATFLELAVLDPNFYLGTSKFEFPNGDKYDGEFCAHSSGLVWRQGLGTYTTSEGQIYVGEWDGDKLVENKDVEITFPDGVKYYGPLSKSKYSGPGVYYQPEEKVSLTCTFQDNKPSGEVTLVDPNNDVWHGFAETDDCLLIREHQFYRSIGKDMGKGNLKILPEDVKDVSEECLKKSESSVKYSDIRNQEKEIFAKTKKTSSGQDTSEWYQNYVDYCREYEPIIYKAKTNGESCLTAQELEWFRKYKEFEKNYLKLLQERVANKPEKPLVDNKLFKFIHSEEYKASIQPVPVFFPREDSEDCDSFCEC